MAEVEVRRVPWLFPPSCVDSVVDFMQYFRNHISYMDRWSRDPERFREHIKMERESMSDRLANLLREMKVCQ